MLLCIFRYILSVVFCDVLFFIREVFLNVINELYEIDVYNVMGVIKGFIYFGKFFYFMREC